MFDGDPQARAKDRDRDEALYVVAAALRNGQISQQDHDLRVERVGASATVGELAGLVRDIMAAPAPMPSTAVVPPPTPMPAAPAPAPMTTPLPAAAPAPPAGSPYAPGSARPTGSVPSDLYGSPPSATKRTSRKAAATVAGTSTLRRARTGFLTAAVIIVIAVVGVFVGTYVFTQQVDSGAATTTTAPVPVGEPFRLTGAGLRDFVRAYDTTFDTTDTVRSVFYDGYVVAWVPDGKGHESIWTYRDGSFDQLGDPIDGTAEAAPVDLRDLRPAKVMSLIRTAQQTLGVPDPTTVYVILDRGLVDSEPQLSVYVTNDSGDSGYLLAGLDGTIKYRSKAA